MRSIDGQDSATKEKSLSELGHVIPESDASESSVDRKTAFTLTQLLTVRRSFRCWRASIPRWKGQGAGLAGLAQDQSAPARIDLMLYADENREKVQERLHQRRRRNPAQAVDPGHPIPPSILHLTRPTNCCSSTGFSQFAPYLPSKVYRSANRDPIQIIGLDGRLSLRGVERPQLQHELKVSRKAMIRTQETHWRGLQPVYLRDSALRPASPSRLAGFRLS